MQHHTTYRQRVTSFNNTAEVVDVGPTVSAIAGRVAVIGVTGVSGRSDLGTRSGASSDATRDGSTSSTASTSHVHVTVRIHGG